MRKKINDVILTPRARRLRSWLTAAGCGEQLTPLAGDAGCRCYYRTNRDGQRVIVVDDPSPTQRRKFFAVGEMLAAAAVAVPTVLAADKKNGFMLLEDFGDSTFWHILPDNADNLYAAALRTLIKIQRQSGATLPPYSETLLRREMALFGNWYCALHLRRPLSVAEKQVVAAAADFLQAAMRAQTQVAVHRDYHARNLMVLHSKHTPGVVDFQDAVCGAYTYDIVSLLRDAYVEWPIDKQKKWLNDYWRLAVAGGVRMPGTYAELWMAFNISGAQRGLKVLGIFARLTHRDNKPQFRDSMPLAHQHLLAACTAVPELSALGDIVANRPPPPCER